jgi:AraC-like DNA-binding protein/CheY-like chemotaxis protein
VFLQFFEFFQHPIATVVFDTFLLVLLFCTLFWAQHYRLALDKAKERQAKMAEQKKHALELVTQQQLSINAIGKQMQVSLAQELEKQSAYLTQPYVDQDRRQSSRKNWNNIVKLSERLTHFSLRELSRSSSPKLTSTSSVLAANVEFLKSICQSYQQTLLLNNGKQAYLSLSTGVLDKVLRGLLHALAKTSDANTEVTLTTDCDGTHFHLRLTGFGPGLTDLEVKKIGFSAKLSPDLLFSKRAHDTENDVNLASAQRIIESNGGNIKLVSAINYMTTVFVSFPIYACDVLSFKNAKSVAAKDDRSHLAISKTSLAKPSVLIVDEDLQSQRLLHQSLQGHFTCLACTRALDSLHMIHNTRPEIVYIEQSTPSLGAIELIRLIRNNPQTQALPILVACSLSSQSFKLAALEVGASQVISKPIVQLELRLLLNSLVQHKQILEDRVGEKLTEYHSQQLSMRLPSDSDDEKEQDFIERFNDMITENYSNECFTREIAAKHMRVTERTLNRRLKDVYSHNFNEYLKKYRLEKAKVLLSKGYQISEVAFDVGFNSPSYFSTCFKAEYSISPSQLVSNCA